MKRQNFNISYFVCLNCNNSFPLPRPKYHKREKGHIKDLYCVYCNKVAKTIEVRDGDFLIKNN